MPSCETRAPPIDMEMRPSPPPIATAPTAKRMRKRWVALLRAETRNSRFAMGKSVKAKPYLAAPDLAKHSGFSAPYQIVIFRIGVSSLNGSLSDSARFTLLLTDYGRLSILAAKQAYGPADYQELATFDFGPRHATNLFAHGADPLYLPFPFVIRSGNSSCPRRTRQASVGNAAVAFVGRLEVRHDGSFHQWRSDRPAHTDAGEDRFPTGRPDALPTAETNKGGLYKTLNEPRRFLSESGYTPWRPYGYLDYYG